MKKIFLVSCIALAPFSLFAENSLVLNVRRIGLDWSKTDVGNPEAYADSPIQALKANGQDFMKAAGDVVLEYKSDKVKWDNGIFTEYGKTVLRPHNGPKISNENADKFLASSDLSYAVWETGGFKFGPMARGQYETEYTKNGGVPRQNVVRSMAGISAFGNEIVKDFYIAGVYEHDFTYAGDPVDKTAAEIGWRLEYQIREGVKFSTNGYYREYLGYSTYVGTDLKRDLSAVLRLDTNLWGDLTMGPYVQYRRAKARETDLYGSNFMMGVSFNYITKFGLN